MFVHQIRMAAPVRRLLGSAADTVLGHFCPPSSCAVCGHPVGAEQVNLVVDVAATAGTARLVHRRCGPSQVREVNALPLAPASAYQFRCLLLPTTVDGATGVLPAVMLRLAVDVAILSSAGGGWRPVDVTALDGWGCTTAAVPTLADGRVELTGSGLVLHLGADSVDVTEAGLADLIGQAGAVMVLHVAGGDLSAVGDEAALGRVLADPRTRAVMLDL
jgi:hypothetical protein